jgi:hypothetical protein
MLLVYNNHITVQDMRIDSSSEILDVAVSPQNTITFTTLGNELEYWSLEGRLGSCTEPDGLGCIAFSENGESIIGRLGEKTVMWSVHDLSERTVLLNIPPTRVVQVNGYIYIQEGVSVTILDLSRPLYVNVVQCLRGFSLHSKSYSGVFLISGSDRVHGYSPEAGLMKFPSYSKYVSPDSKTTIDDVLVIDNCMEESRTELHIEDVETMLSRTEYVYNRVRYQNDTPQNISRKLSACYFSNNGEYVACCLNNRFVLFRVNTGDVIADKPYECMGILSDSVTLYCSDSAGNLFSMNTTYPDELTRIGDCTGYRCAVPLNETVVLM